MVENPDSNLPRDPEYWAGLARRIREDAAGPLAAYAVAQDVWYEVLSQRAAWLVGASAAAMLVLWLALPTSESVAFRWLERSLEPNDVAGSLIGGPAPPSVEVLMAQFYPAPPDETGR